MTLAKNSTYKTGLTYKEVLVSVAVVVVLIMVVVVPKLRESRAKAARISCLGNLKQISLGFRIWANDNGDLYPMLVPESEGGAMESVESGSLVRLFQVMSNELSVPKTLNCPADNRFEWITNWADLTTEHVSYAVGIDAHDFKPNMILAGDRNLTTNETLLSGLVELGTNSPVDFTAGLHDGAGNIGLADGSVQQVTTELLRQQLQNSGDETNRLVFPQ